MDKINQETLKKSVLHRADRGGSILVSHETVSDHRSSSAVMLRAMVSPPYIVEDSKLISCLLLRQMEHEKL